MVLRSHQRQQQLSLEGKNSIVYNDFLQSNFSSYLATQLHRCQRCQRDGCKEERGKR